MGDRAIVLVTDRRTALVRCIDVPDVAQASEVGEVLIIVKCHTDIVASGSDMLVD